MDVLLVALSLARAGGASRVPDRLAFPLQPSLSASFLGKYSVALNSSLAGSADARPAAGTGHQDGPFHWERALAAQFSPHQGLRFDRAAVLAAWRNVSLGWASLLVDVHGGTWTAERSKSWCHGVHDERLAVVSRVLDSVANRLPDTTFLLSMQDCGPDPNRFPEVEGILYFASTFGPDRTALSFPITWQRYFSLDNSLVDTTIQKFKAFGREVPTSAKSTRAFWRGDAHGGKVKARATLVEAAKLAPQLLDVSTHEMVHIHDQLALHRNLIYAPGFCGWSGSLAPLILSGGRLFLIRSPCQQFLELELDPGVDYVPLAWDMAPSDLALELERALAQDEREQADMRERLHAKASRILSLENVHEYVVRLVTAYSKHVTL